MSVFSVCDDQWRDGEGAQASTKGTYWIELIFYAKLHIEEYSENFHTLLFFWLSLSLCVRVCVLCCVHEQMICALYMRHGTTKATASIFIFESFVCLYTMTEYMRVLCVLCARRRIYRALFLFNIIGKYVENFSIGYNKKMLRRRTTELTMMIIRQPLESGMFRIRRETHFLPTRFLLLSKSCWRQLVAMVNGWQSGVSGGGYISWVVYYECSWRKNNPE